MERDDAVDEPEEQELDLPLDEDQGQQPFAKYGPGDDPDEPDDAAA